MAKIKVSQATIDNIKKMGMTKALAGAKSANPEMKEALTRMYGAARVAKSAGQAKATPSTQRKYGTPNNTSKPKMVDAKGPNAIKMPSKGPMVKVATKKSGTTDPFAKAVFSAGRAVGSAFTPDWKKKEAAMKAAKNKTK